MQEHFSTDTPVKTQEEDKFQRYYFSKRIADVISQRVNSEGIVIGIYGAWGEGKTSVLNFIAKELEIKDDIVQLKLNPWRYKDEDELLKNLFAKIAGLYNKKLKKSKEKIGKFISNYGSIASVVGLDISKVGESISEVGLETLKERVDEFIKESNTKLVIYVDDIDRLDKQELYSLLKLVKLTADFTNTTYILAFDDKMVASAIGERFGNGGITAGQNFLEKIIQIPLKLPIIQQSVLKRYCFGLIEKIIIENGLEFEKEELNRFFASFTYQLLPRLKTPRLAIQYSNSLSFVIPLLKGEVNHADLMLIEGVKILYPKHYEFIKKYPHYFLSLYSHDYYLDGDKDPMVEQQKIDLQNHLDKLSINLSKEEKENIFRLLKELFPQLKTAFDNTHYPPDTYTEWRNNQRIASGSYFDKYFTYTILEGELSDVKVKNFIYSLEQITEDEIIAEIEKIRKMSSMENFIQKIETFDDKISWDLSKKLIYSLASLGETFESQGTFMNLGYDSEMHQVSNYIHNKLKKHPSHEESFLLAQKLMNNPIPLIFGLHLCGRIDAGKKKGVFDEQEINTYADILRKRALQEAGEIPLYEKYPEYKVILMYLWYKSDVEDFTKYMIEILENDSSNSIKNLLLAYTPNEYSLELSETSEVPESYKATFNKDTYQYLTSLLDKHYLHEKIIKYFDNQLNIEPVKFLDRGENNSEINILRQFEYWYAEDLKNSVEETK